MKEYKQPLIKVYTSKNIPFVNRMNLLRRYTLLKWKKEESRMFVTYNVSAYKNTLKEIKGGLNWLNMKGNNKKEKKITIKMKMEKVTMKELKKAHELYEQRKLEKLI